MRLPALSTYELRGVVIDWLRMGEGEPLLFLHSGAAPASHDSQYLSLLAQSFDLIAPTHPGFGRRDRPQHLRTVDDLAYFYLDLLTALDLRGVTLAGAGLGGWIAAAMAVKSTARLKRLVLIAPFGIKAGGREERDFADFWAIPPRERAQLEFLSPRFAELSYAGKSDEELAILARGLEAEAYYGWQPFMHDPQLIHWLHRIDVPALLLRGSGERVIAQANHDAYLARIPDCRARVIAQAGHHPHIDAPLQTVQAIAEFAAARSPAIQ
jgi:pimeloyl-ACP methyl ester carboxylesterase